MTCVFRLFGLSNCFHNFLFILFLSFCCSCWPSSFPGSLILLPPGQAKRDPGLVWSNVTLTIENIREGSSIIRQFVTLSFVIFKARSCNCHYLQCLTVAFGLKFKSNPPLFLTRASSSHLKKSTPGAFISAVSHSLVSGGALGENSSTTRVSSEFCDPSLDSSTATFLASSLIVLQCFTEITQNQNFALLSWSSLKRISIYLYI